MSVQPGPVARLTQLELLDLDGWGFVTDYRHRQAELIDLAKIVYTSLCLVNNNNPPTEAQFHKVYAGVLQVSNLYVIRIARHKKHLPPSLYPHYADLLAKYVREHDWAAISSVPCPP